MNDAETKHASELIKGVGELLKSAGPTDEHRHGFGQTFLGTLLGQTVAMLGMLATYTIAIAITWRYFSEDLKALHDFTGLLFWGIALAPLVTILLFSMLPTALRAWREHRMSLSAIGGDENLNTFRLYPYGEADRANFKRLDGADNAVLSWLKSSRSPLLYFSGASGVGKSSLLAASLIPELRDQEWLIIETRLFGDPIERLRTALVTSVPRLARKLYAGRDLRDLLQSAVDLTERKEASPLLLVIDQFEEFLILHKEEEREKFGSFLIELTKKPISGVRLLLVFRSDYRSLVFKLDLPPLVTEKNWYELSAYDRSEATGFLRSRGRELSPTAIDRLFRGLDQIENAPGLYRLITLNMVGLVLERMGGALQGDPGRLIQSYLLGCLKYGEARDYATALLAHMITDAGTKEPRKQADLVAATALAPWQVKATLAELARQGLVRPLGEEAWEIAHDFLARVIGQLIGRLRPSLWERTRPFIAPIVLAGWIAFGGIGWTYLGDIRQRATETALRALGATFTTSKWNGLEVRLSPEGANLDDALPYLEKIDRLSLAFPTFLGLPKWKVRPEQFSRLTNLRALDLTGAYGIVSLEPLKNLTELRELHLPRVGDVTSLVPLKHMTKLTTLDLTGERSITSLEPLQDLKNLSSLNLRSTGITNLEPLRRMSALRTLNLTDTTVANLEPLKELTDLSELYLGGTLVDLEPLKYLVNLAKLDLSRTSYSPSFDTLEALKELRQLDLSDVRNLTSLAVLRRLTKLTSLDLRSAEITDLSPLKNLTDLTSLRLVTIKNLSDLEPLRHLVNLTSLTIVSVPGITNLEPLKDLTDLTSLSITSCSVTNIEPLRHMTKLTHLALSNNSGITSLEPLKYLTKLETLGISNLPNLTSLEPLRRMPVLGDLDLASDIGITNLEPLKDTHLRILNITGASSITNLDVLRGKSVEILNQEND